MNQIRYFWRLYFRDGIYSLINLIGLTIGIICSIVLYLYVRNELSYDKHHAKRDRIFRVGGSIAAPGFSYDHAMSSKFLGPLLKFEFDDIETFARFKRLENLRIKIDYQSKEFTENRFFKTDPDVFNIFSHEFISGNPSTCLLGPNKIVLTEKVAAKYFGSTFRSQRELLGKTIYCLGTDFVVTAIIEDLPGNSHFKFDALLSWSSGNNSDTDGEQLNSKSLWYSMERYTYFLFKKPDSFEKVREGWDSFFEKYMSEFGSTLNAKYDPVFERLTDIHYESGLSRDEAHGNKINLIGITVIGLFLILVSCINYTNLTTARSLRRSKEIGIRKALGAIKIKLFGNFILETVSFSLISMFLAILFSVYLIRSDYFQQMSGKALYFGIVDDPMLLIIIPIIAVFSGVLSGVFPGMVLSNISTLIALKGKIVSGKGTIIVRKSLVIIQMIVSLAAVTLTLLMKNQIEFMKKRELGFDDRNMLIIPIQDSVVSNRLESLRKRLELNTNIISASYAHAFPGGDIENGAFRVENEDGSLNEGGQFHALLVGPKYLETMGIELVLGRSFDERESDDNGHSFIVNEEAVKSMGFSNNGEAIGKKIGYINVPHNGQIIGVVKNFHHAALHNKIEPLVIGLQTNFDEIHNPVLHLRFNDRSQTEVVNYSRELLYSSSSFNSFYYFFLEDFLNNQYRNDENQNDLISFVSIICIILSLLGLLSFTVYNLRIKVHEISIRKVLGASTGNLIAMILKAFSRLILIAIVASIPVTFALYNFWLESFAYRVTVDIILITTAYSFVFLISWITIFYFVRKTANLNPVKSLRKGN